MNDKSVRRWRMALAFLILFIVIFGLSVPVWAATLTGTVTSSTAAVDLAAVGTSDWRRYPGTAKAGSQLSALTIVGSPQGEAIEGWIRNVNGTGNHVYAYGTGAYIEFSAPADTTERTLFVYLGGYDTSGMLTATLAGATTYTHTQAASSDDYTLVYRLTYRADAPTTIAIRWARVSGNGNVSIQGAAVQAAATPEPPVVDPPTQPAIGTAQLTWTPPTLNTNGTPLTNLIGYRLRFGLNSAALSQTITFSSPPPYLLTGLVPGTWYFGLQALTSGGGESAMSNIATQVIDGNAPAPTPVDCVVSEPVKTSESTWSACVNSSRSKTETWTRTITTQPANGGAACPVLTEQRVVTEACTPPAPVDPCVADPLRIINVTWPTAQSGRRTIGYDSGTKLIASVAFAWRNTMVFTDTRGCTATVTR